MKVKINGVEEEIGPMTITQLVAQKSMNPETIVIEHNKEILTKEQWKKIKLNEKDTLEIISFVGGG